MAVEPGNQENKSNKNFWKWMALVALGVVTALTGIEAQNTLFYFGGLAIGLVGLAGGASNYVRNH